MLIMNRGHHATLKEGQSDAVFQRDNKAAVDYIREHISQSRRRLSVYYMTTSPGHAYCDRFAKPNMTAITNEQQYESIVKAHLAGIPLEVKANQYGWELYHERDQSVIQLMKARLNATIIDIAPMTYSRPDGHRFENEREREHQLLQGISAALIGDCLHYFLPSVIDNWVYMFYNVMD
jgi:hypothetical protein